MYTGKPVLVSQLVRGIFTYQTNTATVGQALLGMQAELGANGILLTNDDAYNDYKLIPAAGMNQAAEAPHIEIEIRANSVILNGKLVPLERITDVFEQVTPETEVWIHDPSDPFEPTQSDSTNLNYSSVLQQVKQAKVREDMIYRVYQRTDFLPK